MAGPVYLHEFCEDDSVEKPVRLVGANDFVDNSWRAACGRQRTAHGGQARRGCGRRIARPIRNVKTMIEIKDPRFKDSKATANFIEV